MASNVYTYSYDGNRPLTLVKWKIKKGSQLYYNSVILSYKEENSKSPDGKDPLLKYKSNIGGTVSELVVSEGAVIQPGAELLKVQPCTHSVIMKDLCAECGADLRNLDRDNFEKLTAATTFSMVHVVPELKVSLEQAEKLGRDDEVRLLKNKKLVLLVDLDQTLIHTTNDNVPEKLPGVHHFQLYGVYSPWYHTKLRPGTKTFLENISKYYELHICTFGARLYAHKIAKILDPNGKFFSHRILSRDECFDANSKTGNLKALFPRGDDMVCIIDDREDVWNFAPNVIHVKPYSYFQNTGDINAPLSAPSFNPKEIKQTNTTEKATPSLEKTNTPKYVDTLSDKKSKGSSTDVKQNGVENSTSPAENTTADLGNGGEEQAVEKTSTEAEIEEPDGESVTKTDDSATAEEEIDPQDQLEDYLLYLEEILIRVHKTYYDMHAKMKNDGQKGIPDLKAVVPYLRSKVLKNCNIVFSSVIPTNCVPESHHLWTLTESLGARVSRELQFEDTPEKTTHVVSSKAGTVKVNAARRHAGVHVVTLDWLLCCAERWEHADERLFSLPKDLGLGGDENSSHSFHEAKQRLKRQYGGKVKRTDRHKQTSEEEKFSERIFLEAGLSLSQDDIAKMDQEIDEACSEESDDENTTTSQDSSSSVESLSSGDYPRGWKKRKKCADVEDGEQQDHVSGSSDADTIGSVDEEIAEAVKQEFENC